jgi:tetratricopeptide (TPR) repeat protein
VLYVPQVHAQPGAAPAPSQPSQAQEAPEAEHLIAQGLALREQGQDAAALEHFERAHELHPTPRSLAQRGLCELALGRWLDAETHLDAALSTSSDPWIKLHNRALAEALVNVRSRIGMLQVQGGEPDAEVRLEGKLVGRLPLTSPLHAVAGQAMLEVTLAGYYPSRRYVVIAGGALATETVELVPLPPPTAAPAEPPPSVAAAPPLAATSATLTAPTAVLTPDAHSTSAARSPGPWLFWTGVGATAVLGGLTAWSAINTKAKNDAYVDYAMQPLATRAEAQRGYESAHGAQTRTNVLVVSTALLAAATVTLGVAFTDWRPETRVEPFVALNGAAGGLHVEQTF